MASKINRRRALARGLGAVGWISTGALRSVLAADGPAVPMGRPDRSARAPASPVSIQRCESYEPARLRRKLDEGFEQIGGLGKLVANKTVTIKINVTGGPAPMAGLPGYRTYQTHPNMLAAVCAALHDAGAKRIVVVESQYSDKTPEEVLGGDGWDVKGIQAAGGQKVVFEDTRHKGAHQDYSTLKVAWGGLLYPAFVLNSSYARTDVMVSLAKLKDHLCAGVTLSVKNLFGITPTSLYGEDAPNEKSLSYRGPVLHNGTRDVPAGVPGPLEPLPQKDWRRRVPRVTADILGARPIDLAIIEGIETNRGGEGPWASGVEPLNPKLIIVGRNPVCTDAVATAVMGYDPLADHGQFPFPGDNHLRLLNQMGVGRIDPGRIDVRGLTIRQALFPFNPKRVSLEVPTALYSRPGRPGLTA
jgi:uncharacterized protein (DUF362 family)